MNRSHAGWWASSLLIGAGCWTAAAAPKVPSTQAKAPPVQAMHGPPEPMRLLPVPRILLPPHQPPTAAEAERIRNLIAALARIDSPDFGLSPSMSGTAFAPIEGMEQSHALVLGAHGLKRSSALVELVKLGPLAMPFLLAALDDRTPTRLTLKLGGILHWMYFAMEADFNPKNAREDASLSALPKRDEDHNAENYTRYTHTVTVGDVCFVILGQITGRGYEAVRYQPTGGMVVNSPTASPAIAKAIRAALAAEHPEQGLLDFLLLDYSTRGVHVGESFNQWGMGERYQSPAATRLLYYFPELAAPLIAKRLNSVDVRGFLSGARKSDREHALRRKRELANEVRTKQFLRAVAWCREPEVRAALVSICERTTDPELLDATLQALDEARWPAAREHIRSILGRLPASEDAWYGDDYRLLVAAYATMGEASKPLFTDYLRGGTAQKRCSVKAALKSTRGEWDLELLVPLLADRRPTKYSHQVSRDPNAQLLSIRVCDQAAEVLCRRRKDLKFEMIGTKDQLDERIRTLKMELDKTPVP